MTSRDLMINYFGYSYEARLIRMRSKSKFVPLFNCWWRNYLNSNHFHWFCWLFSQENIFRILLLLLLDWNSRVYPIYNLQKWLFYIFAPKIKKKRFQPTSPSPNQPIGLDLVQRGNKQYFNLNLEKHFYLLWPVF